MADRGMQKKRAPRRRPLGGKYFWGKLEALERRLDGSDCARVAVAPPATVNKALGLTVVRIVVADVGRPVVQEAEGQARVPIIVIVGNLLV
jgi:hypothetical protein